VPPRLHNNRAAQSGGALTPFGGRKSPVIHTVCG
jgi:hypothetical protein